MTDDRTRLSPTPEFGTWFHPVAACPGPRSTRLFCFPHAGGAASTFSAWRGAVLAGLEIHAAQLPGRESRIRERPIGRLGELVDRLTAAIEPATGEPLALFGHSTGALVAWELARALRRTAGVSPVHLFVSACQPPSAVRSSYEDLPGLDDTALMARLAEMNGTPAEAMANPELMRMVLPAIRADLGLFADYDTPGDILDCPVTALGGDRDPVVAPGVLAGWGAATSGELAVHVLPGDHFYLTDPRAGVLGLIGTRLATTTPENV